MTLGWLHRKEAEPNLIPKAGGLTRTLLLSCPVVFSSFVAVYSRSYTDSFTVPAGSPAQDAVVMAYSPFVSETRNVLWSREDPESRESMVTLANKWTQAVRDGRLLPIVAVSFEDEPETGARGEILRAKSKLVARLIEDARLLALKGHAKQAAKEALLALQLSESLKYTTLNTAYISSAEQQKAVLVIDEVRSRLSSIERTCARNELLAIQDNSANLATLTRVSRTQYYEWLERMSKEPISIEDVHRTALITEKITADPVGKESMKYVRTGLITSPVDSAPQYLSELRVAWAAENATQKQIKKLLSTL